ncbi:MAG: hypothetical protein JO262_11550 [Solirubrobacterales bacterium]|nr:hypothetical protein [Solirubrobacterales bacterium]
MGLADALTGGGRPQQGQRGRAGCRDHGASCDCISQAETVQHHDELLVMFRTSGGVPRGRGLGQIGG